MARTRRTRSAAGQASVEAALVLPVVAVVLLVVVQAVLIARDQIVVVHAARVAARAVAVEGRSTSAARSVAAQGLGDRARVSVSGRLQPGGTAVVVVELDPVRVPVVGRGLGGLRLRQRFAVLVEGP